MRHNWEKRNACRILVGNPEGKRPLGRPRSRGSIVLKCVLRDRIDLAQDRNLWKAVVNTVMNFRAP
jgi:hypothetical protein